MQVDLVVNTFERTYRDVLAPGVFDRIAEQNRFAFARRVALVNNVDDRADAEARARALIDAGGLDDYLVVADHLDAALATTGLTRADLEPSPHYTDCALVAVTGPGSPWLLYWDADVTLSHPFDWITPAVELMEGDPRILVANPGWGDRASLEHETLRRSGDFALGVGFSDQVFLARRAELGAPIYGQRCVTRLRYPEAERGVYVFEARVDAHMRHAGRQRATHTGVDYHHPAGATSHKRLAPLDRARQIRNGLILRAVRASPVKRGCWRGV